MGDVVEGQVPTTVLIPDALFNQLAVVQVPTPARLDQLLLADHDTQVVGPFAAGEADIEAIATRSLMIVPNEFVRPFLSVGMRPREAYQLLKGLIDQGGHAVACEPLIDWLRVAMTRRAVNGPPRTAIPPLGTPMYAPPDVHQAFLGYRRD